MSFFFWFRWKSAGNSSCAVFQVVDLLAPYAKGGKIGLFGGAGVGKTVGDHSLLGGSCCDP